MVENQCGVVWDIFYWWLGDEGAEFSDVYAVVFGGIGDICGITSAKNNGFGF